MISMETTFSKRGQVSKDRSWLVLDAIETTMCMEDWHQEEKLFQFWQNEEVIEDFTNFSVAGDNE